MIAWLMRIFGRPLPEECPAEVRIWSVTMDQGWGDEPRMRLLCSRPLGHSGRHRGKHGATEWESVEI